MPRILGRLWRSGGRRAQVPPAGEPDAPRGVTPEAPDEREEIGRRIEAARKRLRQTIAPPQDSGDPRA